MSKFPEHNNMLINIRNQAYNNCERFFNYNQDSCWLDSFLFVLKKLIFNNNNNNNIYIKKFSNWNIDKNLLFFLEDMQYKR